MKTNLPQSVSRFDRYLKEHIHDPYKTKPKLSEPAVCPICKAVFHNGRWQWMTSRPIEAEEHICQACHRVRDKYPAGIITLSGDFLHEHRQEILNLIRHEEKEENASHPLHRIMNTNELSDHILVETTDIHLPHRIGHALHKAYKGELDLDYEPETYFIRIHWRR